MVIIKKATLYISFSKKAYVYSPLADIQYAVYVFVILWLPVGYNTQQRHVGV
jgi:hypothetical protein